MTAEEEIRNELGLPEVEVTIDVVPGPVSSTVAALSAHGRLGVRVACAALLVAVVSGAVALAGAGGGGASRGPGQALVVLPLAPANPAGALATFGIRSHCVRRAIVSRDGRFARVDYDRGPACGAAGNHVTLILRRVHRAWVAAFDATNSRCPATALPRPVLVQLRLCRAVHVSGNSGRNWRVAGRVGRRDATERQLHAGGVAVRRRVVMR